MPSRKTRRAAMTAGLGVGSLLALAESTLAQEPAAKKAESPSPEPKLDDEKTGNSKSSYTASIGVVDIEAILRDSRKFQTVNEEIKAEVSSRQKDLQKIVDKGKELAEDLGRMTPGTPDHDRVKGQLEQLSARLEAEKRKAQQEFSAREARELAAIYKEIEKHVESVARSRGITLVLRLSSGSIDGKQPQQVMAEISRGVVFADPRLDITAEVRARLNRR